MSGRLQRATGRQPLAPHTHVVVTFQQGGDLRFIDPRTFGEMFVTSADELGKVKELQHLAIDPLDQVFTWPSFQYLLAQKAAKMKQLLMDQKFISGLGNIYSDEVLFHAGLRFDRLSDTLSSQEVRRLYRAIQEVLQEAIKARGTTLEDEAYLDLFGEPGGYGAELKVYGRAGLPCRRCRTPIETRAHLAAVVVLLPAVPELSARGQTISTPASRIRVIARSPSPGVRSTAAIAPCTTSTR